MSLTDAEKGRLKRAGLSGLNKPKRTPKHPTKKAVVAIRDGDKVKASFKSGLLSIEIPKIEPKKPKKTSVKIS